MRYRIYSGPRGSQDVSPIGKRQMLFKEFGALDDALSWARQLEQGGRSPLLIEGDDDTRLDRRALRVGMREEVDWQPATEASASPRP